MKKTQRNHSELKEPHETLDKTKTLTTIARQKKAKEKALKLSIQTGKEPYINHSKKNRAYKMLKRTTKPLRRRVLIEEGLAKSSKKQHSENTCLLYTSPSPRDHPSSRMPSSA